MAVSITEFQLDEYRGGNPLRVLDLGNGLNVALVQSEAGRSQLLQVVPWTFYGPGNFFPAAARGGDDLIAPGKSGAAKIRSDHGVFFIEREWEDLENTIPRLTANDGQSCPPDYLDKILEGLPAKSYREIFTFELVRLRRMVRNGRYGEDRLTRLAQYLQRKSPQKAVTESSPHHQLLGIQSRLTELTGLIQDSVGGDSEDSAPMNRDKLKGQLAKLETEMGDSKAKQEHLKSEIAETQCGIAAHRISQQLNEVNRELSDSRPSKAARETASLDEESTARIDDQIEILRQELKDLKSEREELKRQGRELGSLKKVAQLAPQIDAVLMQEKTLIREEASIEQIVQQIQDLDARLESVRRTEGTRAEMEALTPSKETHSTARIDALSERMHESEREIQVAEDRLARAETSGNLVADNLARASAYATYPEDAVAIHEAEERLIGLRELDGLDDELQSLEVDRDDLSLRLKRLYARQLMPFQMMMALGIPFMIGVAMIIYGLIMNQGYTNWRLVILGFAATMITSLIKISMDRGTGDMLRSVRKRLSRVNFQIDDIVDAREESSSTGLSLARQIEDAERNLAKVQTRFAAHETNVPHAADGSHGASSIDSARLQLNDARHRDQELKQLWRELMLELDLSPNLTAVHAREVLAERASHSQPTEKVSEAQNFDFQIQQLRGDLDRRREWLSIQTSQSRQLIKELGFSATKNASVAEQIDVLRESMSDHKDRMQTRRQLLRSLGRLRQQQQRVKEKGRRLSEQRRKLDDDLRVRQEQLRIQKQLENDRCKLLEKQRDSLQREMAEIRDRFGIGDELPLAELTGEELDTRLENQKSRLSKLQDRLVRQSEQRGRCRAQINMSSEGTNSTPDVAWDDILHKANELTEDYRMRLDQLSDTTDRYLYLDQAASYLRELSAGQFVDLDVSQEGDLLLTNHEGSTARLSDVRPEHNANVYFSLWLARLEAYSSRGLRLPIVMEDPLEATDPSRRPIVAKLLTDFAAQGYQVILVTSDPNNAELFSRLDVPIADLSERETEREMETEENPEALPAVEIDSYEDSGTEWEQPIPAAASVSHQPLFPPLG